MLLVKYKVNKKLPPPTPHNSQIYLTHSLCLTEIVHSLSNKVRQNRETSKVSLLLSATDLLIGFDSYTNNYICIFILDIMGVLPEFFSFSFLQVSEN